MTPAVEEEEVFMFPINQMARWYFTLVEVKDPTYKQQFFKNGQMYGG